MTENDGMAWEAPKKSAHGCTCLPVDTDSALMRAKVDAAQWGRCVEHGYRPPPEGSEKTEDGLDKVYLSGGKRTHIGHSAWLDDWWVGWGKDESCQFEGPWLAMAVLAAKILRHPNTQKVAPNLYQPSIPLTEKQEGNY